MLVARGRITETDVAQTLAREFELPFVDLSTRAVDAEAVAAIPSDAGPCMTVKERPYR